MTVRVEMLTGEALAEALPAVARLRIEVFRAWPYLYDGSEDYERRYLEALAAARGAVLVAAIDGDEVVGASTGLPMAEEMAAFRDPLTGHGLDVARIFYCAESVLRLCSAIWPISEWSSAGSGLPWQMIAQQTGAFIDVAPLTADHQIDLDAAEAMLTT